MIKFNHVSYSYGTELVLDKINLHIEKKECVSIIGPSGAGKTTLLNIASGVEKQYNGEILLNGVAPIDYKHPISYMTQKDLLLPFYTLYKNMSLPLLIKHRSKKEIEEKVNTGLKNISLYEARDKYPAQLSGGMKQRASLLRAFLIEDVEIMLLDEPFSALDAFTRASMQELLLQKIKEEEKTVLFITHDIEEAILLSDKVVVLSKAPATIIKVLPVPFSREERKKAITLESDFIAIKKEILTLLQELK